MTDVERENLGTLKSHAQFRVHEALKLLRRAKKKISTDLKVTLNDAVKEVVETLSGDDATAIKRGSDRLGVLVDEHLGEYRKPAWRESAESVFVAIIIALLLRSFVVEAFKIPSGSMIPTLAIGDQIFVNKMVYGVRIPFTSVRLIDFGLPERGDVVVFIFPGEGHEDYIKRTIGLPGDEIVVQQGTVYVNGEPIPHKEAGSEKFWDRNDRGKWHKFRAFQYNEIQGDRHYTVLEERNPYAQRPDFGPVTVPKGHIFVMGDNRDHSYDGRSWGYVPLSNVLGKAMFVWWSSGAEGLAYDRFFHWID